jgi:hypothetical protein
MEKKKTQSPTSEIKEVDQTVQPKNNRTWLIVLVTFLSILFLSIIGYIVYTQFLQPTDDMDQDTNNTVEENEGESTEETTTQEDTVGVCEIGDEGCLEEEEGELEQSYTNFEGEVITAQLPLGWNIIEYFDGDGTEALPGDITDYEGLTAIDIISDDNRQVFTLQAVSGIGFAGCPQYAKFEDNSESYEFQQESMNDEMGEEMDILDYTDTEYVEFEFLGVTFRRVGDKYYYDTQEGNNYFEPPCVEGLLTLEGLYFTDEDGYIYEAYFYGPTEDATEEDLPIIDDILESIELVD